MPELSDYAFELGLHTVTIARYWASWLFICDCRFTQFDDHYYTADSEVNPFTMTKTEYCPDHEYRRADRHSA